MIEWSHSTNTTVGDTVYIYVSEKYKSIMFKCEVIAADQYGNRSTDDFRRSCGVICDTESMRFVQMPSAQIPA